MNKGRILAIAFVVLSIAFTASRFMGNSTHSKSGFPGIGSESDWTEARKIAKESANATRAQNFDVAINLGQQAITKYPYDPDFINNTGFAMLLRGQPDDARQAEPLFRKAIELRGDQALYWDNLGRALYQEGQLPQAHEAFAKALTLNPPSQEAAEIQKNIEIIEASSQQSGAPRQ